VTGFSTFIRVAMAAFVVAAAAAQSTSSNDALFSALRRGAAADVERLLAGGASPNALDADGTPALMAATLFGDARMVDLLLKRGADANKSDASGATALMWAVSDIDKVRLLLARGADVTAKSKTGRTALLVAAAFPGTVDVLRLLLDRGADVRAQDGSGTTALAFAVRSSDVDVVRLLVDRGLDPSALSPPARRSAFVRHDLATTNYLMSKKLGPTPDVLMAASMWQSAPLVARWIELGADVNQTSPAAQYARTALLTTVTSEGQGADALRILLERGADPNARTTEGESALDWAIYKGDRAKIELLEKHGATRGDGPRRQTIPPPPATGVVSADARVALSRAVARVLEVAPKFREQTGCISCHHNALPALAAAVTRKKGIGVNEPQARKNVEDILAFFRAASPRMMLSDAAIGGEAITAGYAQMALAAEGHPLDTVTAVTTHWLLARQMTDGQWLGNGIDRPPSEYSTISHTALAAGGLRAYELPGRREEIRESLRRAQRWLLSAPTASAEERGMRLMGLVWTNAPRSRIDEAIAEIRARQEPGGGWSQTGRTDADAYATGLSLYALHLAGVPADDAYRKGVAFLLATQYPDGAWLVRTHSFPVQRYFESGFPFGRHQWISAAGTSWASLAIAQVLP
jgi:ankyrin repeat protein